MPAVDPAWIALIGTLCGGLGLKLLEHWLGKSKVKMDEATRMRDELRTELNTQRDDIKALEAEVDKWRMDYYDLRDKYSELNSSYKIALDKIKEEAVRAAKRGDEGIDPAD